LVIKKRKQKQMEITLKLHWVFMVWSQFS